PVHCPHVPVFSNTLGAAYPAEPSAIRALLAGHLTSPVLFADEVRAMYAAGARVFVEVGPRTVLTTLTRQTLGDRAVMLPLDGADRDGLLQLQHVLAQIAAAGAPVRTGPLFAGRTIEPIDEDTWRPTTSKPAASWLV